MEHYGFLTLVPAIIIILIALKTKKTFEALVIGGLIGCIIAAKAGFLTMYMDFIYATCTDSGTVWIILTCGIFGSFIALLRHVRATDGFANLVLKYADSEKKSLLVAWVLGIIIFVDEYLNVLTIGNAMKSVCDERKTPREMLAYIIDSTGVPVCMLIPISTQAVYWAGMLEQEPSLKELGSGMDIFIKTIPVSFYAIAATFVVPLVILGVIPQIGPMKKAYQRVQNTGKTYSLASEKFNLEETQENSNDKKGNLADFIIPMVVLIAVAIWNGDLLIAVIAALVVQIIMYFPRRLLNFNEFSDLIISGFGSMMTMFAIIVSALALQKVMAEIGLANYVIEKVAPIITPELLPAIAFIVVALLSFITGSCWGVPALTIPIIVPLGFAVGADPVLTVAAILSSATFGAHACFYSDATVLSSTACGIENMDHALTQIPYALIAATIALIGFLVTGFIF